MRVGALSHCGEAALRRKQPRLSAAPRELSLCQYHRRAGDLLSSQGRACVFDLSRCRPERAASLLERAFGVLRVLSRFELAKPVLKLRSLRTLRSIVGYAGRRREKAGKAAENEAPARCARATVLIDM